LGDFQFWVFDCGRHLPVAYVDLAGDRGGNQGCAVSLEVFDSLLVLFSHGLNSF
jgi:hypothetical protein